MGAGFSIALASRPTRSSSFSMIGGDFFLHARGAGRRMETNSDIISIYSPIEHGRAFIPAIK